MPASRPTGFAGTVEGSFVHQRRSAATLDRISGEVTATGPRGDERPSILQAVLSTEGDGTSTIELRRDAG
jgi:hypothetical protein